MPSVGNDPVLTCRSLREPGNQGTAFCLVDFLGGRHGWRSSSICAGWRPLTPHKRNDRITQCDSVYTVGHPRCKSYVEYPLLSPEGATPQINRSIRLCHPYARKSPSQAVLSRMKLTPSSDSPNTSRFASRLVQAMSAWSVKTRRAPSRHCRDGEGLWSNDYGHA